MAHIPVAASSLKQTVLLHCQVRWLDRQATAYAWSNCLSADLARIYRQNYVSPSHFQSLNTYLHKSRSRCWPKRSWTRNAAQTDLWKVRLRPNTSSCPRFSAVIFVCAENVVKIDFFFCIMANFMLYIGTHSIRTCDNLLHIIIIIIIIIITIIIIIIINPKETLNETLKKP